MNDILTAHDYMTYAYLELVSHPNFSEYAYRVVATFYGMSTTQLEKIQLTDLIAMKATEPEHEETEDCWCLPQIKPVPHEDGSISYLIIHNRITDETTNKGTN